MLTSTYGDGDAPASARQFMARLKEFRAEKNLRYTVLGFGDRQFPNFCQFALSVDAALAGKGVSRLHAIELIDRCSASQFSEWGNRVGEVIGTPLFLNYCALQPATVKLELVERADYGIAVQAPTSIFRFKPAEQGGWLTASPRRFKALPPFEAGDLLGVIPPHGQPRGSTRSRPRQMTKLLRYASVSRPAVFAPVICMTSSRVIVSMASSAPIQAFGQLPVTDQ